MILKRIKINVGTVGETNCYIVQDENTKEAIVIDPGGEIDKISDMLDTLEAKVKYILLTH
ncbi:MAG: MBL fold metallo-hydrolase, partial [Clostridia bacterium]|nr:MBL fold metallo-hydrolase [Clostridia bacterium]